MSAGQELSDLDCTYHYYHDGDLVIEERNGSDQVIKQYVWGALYIDELVQVGLNDDPTDSEQDVESFYYALHDTHFNVIGLVDASGGLVERYDYSPYGQRTVYTSPGTNDPDCHAPILISKRQTISSVTQPWGLCNIGFQGLMHDEETGNVHNRARVWSPTLGRFMQRDPLGYPDGMSAYAGYHAMGGGLDPSGLEYYMFNGMPGARPLDRHPNLTADLQNAANAATRATYNLTGSQTATEIVGTAAHFTAGVTSLLDLGAIDRACQDVCEKAEERMALAGESGFEAYGAEFMLQFTPYGVGVGVNEAFHGSSRRGQDYGRYLDGLTERWPRAMNGVSVLAVQTAQVRQSLLARKLALQNAPSPASQAKKCDTCPIPDAAQQAQNGTAMLCRKPPN